MLSNSAEMEMSQGLIIYLVLSYCVAGWLWTWSLAELVYVEVQIQRYRRLLKHTWTLV